MQYRHEQKFLIDARQEADLLLRCRGLLLSDPYASQDGIYRIRSVYFDDCHDTCLKDNLQGVDPRTKFRIRRYDHNPNRILLEKKSKRHGLTRKDSCLLTREECDRLLAGEWIAPAPEMPGEKQRLLLEMSLRKLLPKIIVTYERVPFIEPNGNVRVTFDRKITSSHEISLFFTNDYLQRPVFPDGVSLLEVKWDELLPQHVQMLLQTERMHRTAFSKYAMCRTYHL